MPPAVIAAGIGAAGALGGAALSSRSANRASDVQQQANREALAFEREQAARAEAAYRQAWQERQAMRNALLERYGIDVPALSSPMAPGQAAPGAAPQGMAPQGVRVAAAPRGMLSDMPPNGGVRGAGLTLGELAMRRPVSEWNTFRG